MGGKLSIDSSLLKGTQITTIQKEMIDDFKGNPRINIDAVRQVFEVYNRVLDIVNLRDTRVVCEFETVIGRLIGGIDVIGAPVFFYTGEGLYDALKMSDSFDICPKVNGTVRITFGFLNLER